MKVIKSFFLMIKGLFVRERIEEDMLKEEALRTPMKTILLKLIRNKTAVAGFLVFFLIFCFSFIGSVIFPLDVNYTELTNMNIRPSQNFLRYPRELNDKNIVKIVSGVSFSVALTDDGNLHIWGTECNVELEGITELIMDIPEEIRNANIVDIEAGMRFVITLDDEGNFSGWGQTDQDQTILPDNIKRFMAINGCNEIVQIAAATMWSAIVTDNGRMYLWGSFQAESNYIVPADAQGKIVQIATGEVNMLLLLDDGTVRSMGMRGTEFYELVPEELMDGSVNVVEIAATNRNVVVRDDEGRLYTWGSPVDNLNKIPEELNLETAKYIAAGLNNFIAVDDDGDVFVWGAAQLGQYNLPRNINNAGVVKVFADAFQFYAVDEEYNIVGAWGNKGYIFGSDQLGRDIFVRMMHGGRMSLTVCFIAVIIATTIAIIIGLTSGFFGGWVDHTLMRVADVFDAIPFLPIAVTLSFVIGHEMSQEQRLYLLMVILGVLSWQGLARLMRAQLLLEREKDFVLAARALGIKQRSIMFRHILPNVFNFVIVSVTLSYASFLLIEAVLSYLGFGVREPTPSWGNMLTGAESSMVMRYYWWRWIIPGLFVISACLSINMIGDALREAMDPKSEER
ncbi:MAG: ABC transporter permease subunit [Oscillospiraceae bacterium]|jgi:peptide/nickel transport system permease protein|nr:ABC transporter permease subunit [Oscillospiraceae bacterium]